MNKLILNKRPRQHNQKGFTIIEVVLVLAIAGLIFLTVFLALPALQKSQRDNTRRQDVGKVVAGLHQYVADNGNYGTYLGTGTTASSTGYFAGLAQATAISIEGRSGSACQWFNVAIDAVKVRIGCTCQQVKVSGVNNTIPARYAAVYVELESGGVYCKDA